MSKKQSNPPPDISQKPEGPPNAPIRKGPVWRWGKYKEKKYKEMLRRIEEIINKNFIINESAELNGTDIICSLDHGASAKEIMEYVYKELGHGQIKKPT